LEVTITFKYHVRQRVVIDLTGAVGEVTTLSSDKNGLHYYVRTESMTDWFDEDEIHAE